MNLQDVELIAKFITEQMDGSSVPPNDSAELRQLSASVKRVLGGGDAQLHLLATRVIGALIDRVRSSLAASTMLKHLQRGERDEY